MPTDSILGLPWWMWALLALLVVAGFVIAVIVRSAAQRTRKRVETETLAQKADAAHEGAMTRHEGGA